MAVEPRLERIAETLDLIRQHRPPSVEDLEADDLRRSALEHWLLIACQATLDVAAHLAARSARRGPDSYADAVRSLASIGVVSRELAERLVEIAGMRNALAHGYLGVDARQVFEALQDLGPIEQFAAAVVDWMDRQ